LLKIVVEMENAKEEKTKGIVLKTANRC